MKDRLLCEKYFTESPNRLTAEYKQVSIEKNRIPTEVQHGNIENVSGSV
jgi:hypothetical protein